MDSELKENGDPRNNIENETNTNNSKQLITSPVKQNNEELVRKLVEEDVQKLPPVETRENPDGSLVEEHAYSSPKNLGENHTLPWPQIKAKSEEKALPLRDITGESVQVSVEAPGKLLSETFSSPDDSLERIVEDIIRTPVKQEISTGNLCKKIIQEILDNVPVNAEQVHEETTVSSLETEVSLEKLSTKDLETPQEFLTPTKFLCERIFEKLVDIETPSFVTQDYGGGDEEIKKRSGISRKVTVDKLLDITVRPTDETVDIEENQDIISAIKEIRENLEKLSIDSPKSSKIHDDLLKEPLERSSPIETQVQVEPLTTPVNADLIVNLAREETATTPIKLILEDLIQKSVEISNKSTFIEDDVSYEPTINSPQEIITVVTNNSAEDINTSSFEDGNVTVLDYEEHKRLSGVYFDAVEQPQADKNILPLENQLQTSVPSESIIDLKAKMSDLNEKYTEQQQEISDLKLQLNASEQSKAALVLEIRQKEEVIIKAQADAMKTEQAYKLELKQLKEKLKEKSKIIEKGNTKEMEDALNEAKAKEAQAISELNALNKDTTNFKKIMMEYEKTIACTTSNYQKLKEEHSTASTHLATLEVAFSDVHKKYERAKTIIQGFKSNEETLRQNLQVSEETIRQHEESYESLKSHAKVQIEKSNKEILAARERYESDISKLKAIIKRLEIKCSSLESALEQKSHECTALSALCDEVTGKKV